MFEIFYFAKFQNIVISLAMFVRPIARTHVGLVARLPKPLLTIDTGGVFAPPSSVYVMPSICIISPLRSGWHSAFLMNGAVLLSYFNTKHSKNKQINKHIWHRPIVCI